MADAPDAQAGPAFDEDRWVRALHNLYLVTLLIAVTTTVTSTVGPRPLAPAGLWLLAVPATVLLAAGDLVVRRWALDGRPVAATGYFLAVAVVVGTLTALFPTFGMVAFGALPLVLVVLRRYAAVAAGAVLTLLPYALQPYVFGWLFGPAAPADVMLHIGPAYTAMVGVALPVLTGLFTVGAVRAAHRQGRARQAAVEQLWAARAELAAAARTTGQAEERRRLAHELHDTLAQGLSGVILQLEAAEQHLQSGAGAAERLARPLDRALRTARGCLTDTRRAVAALRPEPLDGATLADAVTEVCRQVATLSGLPIRCTVTGAARRFAARLEVDVLRVAQEALANAVRHAAATEVTVTLDYQPAALVLTVRDNGCGFHPDHPRAALDSTLGGLGLSTMRERIAAAGGTLTVESAPGAGTAVTAVTPDPAAARIPS